MVTGILRFLLLGALLLAACSSDAPQPKSPASAQAAAAAVSAEKAPPADTTGGFDGQRAFAHIEKLVSFGPRPPASEGIRRAQEYIRAQLQGFGCPVEEDDFEASTPRGRVRMKNILAKIPGERSDVVLFLSHYDTKQLPDAPNFVGANDGGSSTGVLLELARLLCGPRKNKLTIWIAFLDGEEAFVEWSETDGTYGSRQLAAKLALAGELKHIKAVVLADLIGDPNLNIKREANSTKWLTDLVWETAARLGYQKNFLAEETAVEDDHLPFLRRGIPAVDVIDLDSPWWHTGGDTLDKISARSLAIVGHVFLELLPELEKKQPSKAKT